MTNFITKICDLGLMGWRTPKTLGLLERFRPFDVLIAEDFSTIINRYLNTTDKKVTSSKRVDIMRFLKQVSGE
jgi:hypothetical protein